MVIVDLEKQIANFYGEVNKIEFKNGDIGFLTRDPPMTTSCQYPYLLGVSSN